MSPPKRLLSFDILAGKEKVVSALRFETGELYTTLKLAQNLTAEEYDGLHKLYKQRFDGEQAFHISFGSEKNKYIEIIRNESGKIVGAVVYKIKMSNNKLWIHIDLELFDNTHPNYGIMPVITYRLPFSLQLLYPDTTIWIVFLSAHDASFKRVADEEVVPVFKPEWIVKEAYEVLQKDSDYPLELIHDEGGECYIIEKNPAVVKGSYQSPSPSLKEWLFQRFRGNDGKTPEDELKKRDVLVALPPSFDFFETLYGIAAAKGINFFWVIGEEAKQLSASQLIPCLPSKVTPRLFKSSPLFWNNIQIPAEDFNNPLFAVVPKPVSNCKAKM